MILFVPFGYYLDGSKEDFFMIHIEFSWLLNAIKLIGKKEENKQFVFFLDIFGIRIPFHKTKKEGKPNERMKKEKKKKSKKLSHYFHLFKQTFLNELFRFVKRVSRHIFPRKYHLSLTYGFEDPANTGMLNGFILMMFPNIYHSDMIKLYPSFEEEIISGEIIIQGRIIIGVILYYFLCFYFTGRIRQIIRKI